MNETSLQRTVFLVSDSTCITAETLSRSLLSQFDGQFSQYNIPFIKTPEQAAHARDQIAHALKTDAQKPIVFLTLIRHDLAAIVQQTDAVYLNLLQTFLHDLSEAFGQSPREQIGLSHQKTESEAYQKRMDAIHFAMMHDDGESSRHLDEADVIIIGVSRCGKTPTSLYLATHYGLKAANYPLIPEDFERNSLPASVLPWQSKLFGLSIEPERLALIRQERLPNSQYASLENCKKEVVAAERLMQHKGIPWVNTTHQSIEEIAATIRSRRFYPTPQTGKS